MQRSLLGLVLGGLLVLAACSGGTLAEGDCTGSALAGACAQDGGGGNDGGSGGCTVSEARATQACVPGVAAAGQPTTLDVLVNDCLGCFTTVEPCKVDVDGSDVTLSFATRTCPPPGDQACPAVCMEGKATCTLPALAAGTYRIVLEGEPTSTGLAPRELVVKDGAGSSSCTVPRAGTPVPALTVTPQEQQGCTVDADCAPARTGNACQPCACPDTAIRTTAKDAYDARRREAQALCPRPDDGLQCAACAPKAAKCVQSTCTLVAGS